MGRPDHTNPRPGPALRDWARGETAVQLGQRLAGRARAAPKGPQASGRMAVGAKALVSLLVSQAGPGPSDVLWSRPAAPCPVSLPRPTPLSPGDAS